MILKAEKCREIAARLSILSSLSGALCTVLVPILVLLVSYDVAMRYLFSSGSVMLQELEWHLFAMIFLLGAANTLKHDEHVRVDIVYRHRRLSDKTRAVINLVGSVFFLLPFCALLIVYSWDFLASSWAVSERSPDPGGLPARWLIKAVLPLGFLLLLIEGIALTLRCLARLAEKP